MVPSNSHDSRFGLDKLNHGVSQKDGNLLYYSMLEGICFLEKKPNLICSFRMFSFKYLTGLFVCCQSQKCKEEWNEEWNEEWEGEEQGTGCAIWVFFSLQVFS